MQAVISGQAGLAVLVDSDKASVVSYSAPDVEVACARSDIAYFFADATDVVEFDQVTREYAVKLLRQAWLQDRALQLTLILLDRDTEPDTLVMAVKLLDQRLCEPEIRTFVENRLYSAPLPGNARVPSRTSIGGAAVSEFLQQLLSSQNAIERCREAWNRLTPDLFGGVQEKKRLERFTIDFGVFRTLALQEDAPNPLDLARQLAARFELTQFPKVEQILGQWIEMTWPLPEGEHLGAWTASEKEAKKFNRIESEKTGRDLGKVALISEPPPEVEHLSVWAESEKAANEFKWIESEKAGHDLGETAIRRWVKEHWWGFLRARRIEHLQGVRFWVELDDDDFGLIAREFVDQRSLLNQIIEFVKEDRENLDIIAWAISNNIPAEPIIAILDRLNINGHRLIHCFDPD